MKNKIISGVAVLSLMMTFGCSNTAVLQPIQNNISVIQSSKINSGANLSVELSFKDFSTKANTDGKISKTVGDIKSVRLYLIKNNNTNPLLAANVAFSSVALAYPTSQASKTYTFFNVNAGTYYVAAELFSDVAGTVNIVQPVTYDSTNSFDTASGFPLGKRGLSISTNSATVANDNTFTFSDSTQSTPVTAFSVSPKLLNAVGASINTGVTIHDGSSTLPNTNIAAL